MRYKKVITPLALASLAISIPVTSLAAEANLVAPNEIGTSNSVDEQDPAQSEPQDPNTQIPQPEVPEIIPTIPQTPDLSLQEEVASTSPFEIDSKGVLTKYTGTDSEVILPDNVTKINSKSITFGTSSTCVLGTNNLKVTGYPYSEVPLYCEKFPNLTFNPLEQPEEEKFTIGSNGTLTRYWGHDEVVTVPDGVKKIGTKAFNKNNTMKKLILPANSARTVHLF